jgi:hypothetical protein
MEMTAQPDRREPTGLMELRELRATRELRVTRETRDLLDRGPR